MAIMAKAGPVYPVCPAGSHISVCVDVVDLGLVKSTYGEKTKSQHKIRIIWQTGEKQQDATPYYASKRYTLSLHEKAALRKDLESWRGRPFSNEELEGWDVESVLGAAAFISVVQEAKGGSLYANVAAIMRPPKGIPLPELDKKYVRVKDRKPENAADAPAGDDWQATDDDVPF
jgi:hypothetical protein